jgi:hypothetical protein
MFVLQLYTGFFLQLPIPLIDDLLINPDNLSAENSNTWLRRHLIVSTDKVRETATLTIGQRENSMWAAVRKLRFTASNFGQIIAAAKHDR